MKIKENKFLIVAISLIFFFSPAFSQNQWAFLRGHLNSGNNSNEYTSGGTLSPGNRPSSREHCGSGIYNGKIYIFGGEGNDSGSDVWFYDIKSKSWALESNRGPNENYNNLKVESTTAHPGNRSRMASAMDKNGNLWMFGGETKDLGYHTGWNDLWKYNTITKNWTWLGGSTSHTSQGSYRVSNTPDWPRSRYRARGWFDKDGNYWIFGGLFFDGSNAPYPLNDMWKYNVTSGQWTCETGDCNQLHMPNQQSGVYPSSVGQTSVNYKPRARADYGYWLDREGNFWLYAGFNGEVHSGGTLLWDTWKYNTTTKEWTLMTLEDAPSATSPGWNAEPLCWLGNDGLPWMRLSNRSIWKFKNNHWENQRFEGPGTWESPVLANNEPFVFNSVNQPGSHYTTFNHIRNDSTVFLFNGYGVINNNVTTYTGALWQYSLEPPPYPNIEMSILRDDFDPTGASPYTVSNREILIKNIGGDTAKNVVVTVGLGPTNSYSAFKLQNVKVYDSNNMVINNLGMTSMPFTIDDPQNAPLCNFNPNDYKNSVNITIPKVNSGEIIKVAIQAEHCMANFSSPTKSQYSWNHWGVKLKFKDRDGKNYPLNPIYNSPDKSLDSYMWREYHSALPSLSSTTGSKIFQIELGSGTAGSPSNDQNLGGKFSHAQARVDLTLPNNIFIANGDLKDIVGEYAVKNGTGIQLVKVNASEINYGLSGPNNNQSYIIKFPAGQYLPIRRIYLKLRANNGQVDLTGIKTMIRTTYNNTYANMDYGWKPGIK